MANICPVCKEKVRVTEPDRGGTSHHVENGKVVASYHMSCKDSNNPKKK